MRHRLKYVRNAPDGNGTLVRGDMYQVGVKWLLGGVTGHRIWERKTTQQYTLGTRLVTPDGRVFRYAKAVDQLECDYGCTFNNGELFEYVALGATNAVGDKQVSLVISAAAAVIAKDELEGGYISIFKAGLGDSMNRCITGNTAVALNGTAITIYLDDPLDRVATITVDHAEVLANPWASVKNAHSGGDGYASCAGLPNVPAAASEYLWIQTWGIRWMSPAHAGIGGGSHERAVYFDPGSGGIDEHSYSTSSYIDRQLLGFVVDKTTSGVDGAPFIMLQISP